MSVYICHGCCEPVEVGEGYVHSSTVGRWDVHHRECFEGDWSNEYCLAVPRTWTDLLDAHRDLSIRRAERTPA